MDMKGRTVLVTGANSGMGKATVAALADMGASVVMMCRSEERARDLPVDQDVQHDLAAFGPRIRRRQRRRPVLGEQVDDGALDLGGVEGLEQAARGEARGKQALDEIMRQPERDVRLMLCDLGSMNSIRDFAERFKSECGRLDVLINNAGVITPTRQETTDGLELQFGVNHIGHFMLTLLLLGLLKKSADGRIVVVGSGAHKAGKIHFDDYNLKRYSVIKSYGQSKLANLLFVRELDRRLKERGVPVVVNCAHPGAVATQMGVDRKTQFGKTIVGMLRPFFLTPEQGARTAVLLASKDADGVSGQYFYKCEIAASSKRSWDMESAKNLFDLSEQICGVSFNEACPE